MLIFPDADRFKTLLGKEKGHQWIINNVRYFEIEADVPGEFIKVGTPIFVWREYDPNGRNLEPRKPCH